MTPDDKPSGTAPSASFRQVIAFAWREVLQPQWKKCVLWLICGALALGPAVVGPQLLSTMMEVIQSRAMAAPGKEMEPSGKRPAMVAAAQSKGDRQVITVEAGKVWGTFALWAVLLTVIGPFFSFLERSRSVILDLAMSSRIKMQAYQAVLSKPLDYFKVNDRGGLLFLLRDVATECQVALRQLTLDFVLQGIHLVGATVSLLWSFVALASSTDSGVKLGIAAGLLGVGLLAPWLMSRFAERFQNAATGLRTVNQAAASLLEGSLRSPEETQAFDAQDRYCQKYQVLLSQISQQRQAQSKTISLANILGALPSDVVQVLLLGAGLLIALSGNADGATVGPLVAVLGLAPQVMRALQGLGSFSMTYNNSLPSITKIMELLDNPATAPASSHHPPVQAQGTPLSFDVPRAASVTAMNLRFSYDGEHFILDGFTFAPAPGRITALVAAMGAGKSTFFRLLLHFYQPSAGSLTLDGMDVAHWEPSLLHARIGYMAQFPAFTHETLRENFLTAAPHATDEEILALCDESGLSEILEKHYGPGPGSLDQPFLSGLPLSGGEKKLFALVRCLLRKPGLLLLDEPTTGVDNINKEDLGNMIRRCCKGVTTIIVDHDVEWLHSLCDEIGVLESGKISMHTTPQVAAEQSPFYQRLLRCPETAAHPGDGPGPESKFLSETSQSFKQRGLPGDAEIIGASTLVHQKK